MHDALRAGIDEPENRAGHVRRKRRPASLIGDDPQRVDAFGELPFHRFDEIVAMDSEEPRCAEDEMAAPACCPGSHPLRLQDKPLQTLAGKHEEVPRRRWRWI